MATRTANQIYQDLIGVGFTPAQAVTMTAIALAESGGNDAARGDLGLQNNTWGPSYGLYQIRTLKADTGHGDDRDVLWLSASDTNQAAAAYQISHGGADFTPWTTYTRGTYQRFLGQAQSAASSATLTKSGGGPFPTFGPSWLPWNIPSDIGNAAANQALSGTRTIVIEGLAVVLGVGLVGVGLVRAVGPRLKAKSVQAARVAAKVV